MAARPPLNFRRPPLRGVEGGTPPPPPPPPSPPTRAHLGVADAQVLGQHIRAGKPVEQLARVVGGVAGADARPRNRLLQRRAHRHGAEEVVGDAARGARLERLCVLCGCLHALGLLRSQPVGATEEGRHAGGRGAGTAPRRRGRPAGTALGAAGSTGTPLQPPERAHSLRGASPSAGPTESSTSAAVHALRSFMVADWGRRGSHEPHLGTREVPPAGRCPAPPAACGACQHPPAHPPPSLMHSISYPSLFSPIPGLKRHPLSSRLDRIGSPDRHRVCRTATSPPPRAAPPRLCPPAVRPKPHTP